MQPSLTLLERLQYSFVSRKYMLKLPVSITNPWLFVIPAKAGHAVKLLRYPGCLTGLPPSRE